MTVTAAMALLLLESPSMRPGPAAILVFAAVGGVAVMAAWRHTRAQPRGFLPATVIGERTFVLAALAQMSVMAAYVAVLFAAPLLLIREHGWSATRVGLVLLPAAAMGGVSAYVFGRLSSVWDPFRLAAVLAAAGGAGLLAVGLGNGAALATVVGLALVLAALTGSNVLLVGRVPLMVDPADRNAALGVFTLVFQVGGAVGTALVAGLERPLGLGPGLACVAVVPTLGILAALGSGARRPAPAGEA